MVSRLVPLLCALPVLALAGCGGGRDASDKQLDALRSEIVKLRAETAILTERLDAAELAQGTFRGSKGKASATASAQPSPPAAGGSGGGDDRPDLQVVRLAPDRTPEEGAGEEVEADDGPRPVFRSVNGGGVIEEKSAPVAKGSEAAQRDYDQALELFRAKSYEKAIEAFTGFLTRYPEHDNADNAVFWRGESYLAKGEARRAAEQFEAVVSTYPKGNKAPDALLRLAQSLSTLGDAAGADAARKKLRTSYPSSDAAKKLERSRNSSSAPGTAGGKP